MANMETNAAYGCIQSNAAAIEDNIYELDDVNPETFKSSSSFSPAEVETKKRDTETKKEKKNFCFILLNTITAVTALLLALVFLSFFLVHYATYQQLLETQQSAGIETMQLLLNSSNEQLQLQASELNEAKRFIQSLQLQLNKTVELQESLQNDFHLFIEEQQTNELLTQNRIQGIEQELNNTINLIKQVILRSCNDLPQGSPSGYYHISTNSSGVIRVYCDTSARNCSCDASGGWARVANLDMTDPTQQCPDGFRLIDRTEPPLRTCGRPDGHSDGCVSTTFPIYGIEYSRVCGRIVGYQFGSPSGFNTGESSIDRDYIAGISLTHGLPRQHIWSFVNAQNENTTSQVCPCIRNSVISVPLFVGEDYFCDSAVRGSDRTGSIYHPDDPLWDGQGCGSTSTCCEFNNPPWFCKQLPQPTTDDIELRLCENNGPSHDDSPFELIQLYIN